MCVCARARVDQSSILSIFSIVLYLFFLKQDFSLNLELAVSVPPTNTRAIGISRHAGLT